MSLIPFAPFILHPSSFPFLRGEEWSEGDERHGRLSREVAVEHRGSDRDTRRNQRSESASRMSFSIALTGFGFADCRKALKRFSVSMGSFMDYRIDDRNTDTVWL